MNTNRKMSHSLFSGWVILIVDDDHGSLLVVAMMLKHYGATVKTAIHGLDALEQLKSIKPTLIIADISMPIMDGWMFIHQLKQDPSTADIPVIALTAHAMVGDREQAIAAGFDNYMSKPLTPATFVEELASLLINIPSLASQLHYD